MTERLILEPLVRSHAAEFFAALLDPEVHRYLPQDPPASVEDLARRCARVEGRRSPDGPEHWLNWLVREQSTGSGLPGELA